MFSLGQVGPPDPKNKEDEYNMMHGLSQAIEVLCEPTEMQHSLDPEDVQNNGRIICLTAAKRLVMDQN